MDEGDAKGIAIVVPPGAVWRRIRRAAPRRGSPAQPASTTRPIQASR
jgi:hypothetical protein